MKKIKRLLFNILFYLSILLFASLFVFSAFGGSEINARLSLILPIMSVGVGLLFLPLTLLVSRKGYHLFMALFLLFWGLVAFFMNTGLLPYTMVELWPVLGVSAGLILFVAGLYRYRRLKFGYCIPSVAFLGIGIWLSLFSFHIIKLPFRYVALIGGPLLLIAAVILVIGFFLLQQKYSRLVIKEEDSDSFEDDTPVFFSNEKYVQE